MAFQIKDFTITTEIIIAGAFGPDGNSIYPVSYPSLRSQKPGVLQFRNRGV